MSAHLNDEYDIEEIQTHGDNILHEEPQEENPFLELFQQFNNFYQSENEDGVLSCAYNIAERLKSTQTIFLLSQDLLELINNALELIKINNDNITVMMLFLIRRLFLAYRKIVTHQNQNLFCEVFEITIRSSNPDVVEQAYYCIGNIITEKENARLFEPLFSISLSIGLSCNSQAFSFMNFARYFPESELAPQVVTFFIPILKSIEFYTDEYGLINIENLKEIQQYSICIIYGFLKKQECKDIFLQSCAQNIVCQLLYVPDMLFLKYSLLIIKELPEIGFDHYNQITKQLSNGFDSISSTAAKCLISILKIFDDESMESRNLDPPSILLRQVFDLSKLSGREESNSYKKLLSIIMERSGPNDILRLSVSDFVGVMLDLCQIGIDSITKNSLNAMLVYINFCDKGEILDTFFMVFNNKDGNEIISELVHSHSSEISEYSIKLLDAYDSYVGDDGGYTDE